MPITSPQALSLSLLLRIWETSPCPLSPATCVCLVASFPQSTMAFLFIATSVFYKRAIYWLLIYHIKDAYHPEPSGATGSWWSVTYLAPVCSSFQRAARRGENVADDKCQVSVIRCCGSQNFGKHRFSAIDKLGSASPEYQSTRPGNKINFQLQTQH